MGPYRKTAAGRSGQQYLHSKRIVHRDVKSSNILVKALTGVPSLEYKEGYLSAKIADFGTSKTKISRTRFSKQTSNVGITLWMAPEVFSIDSGAVVPGLQPPAYPSKQTCLQSRSCVLRDPDSETTFWRWENGWPSPTDKSWSFAARASWKMPNKVGLLDTKVLGAQSSREAGFPRNLQRTQIHQRSSPRRY